MTVAPTTGYYDSPKSSVTLLRHTFSFRHNSVERTHPRRVFSGKLVNTFSPREYRDYYTLPADFATHTYRY